MKTDRDTISYIQQLEQKIEALQRYIIAMNTNAEWVTLDVAQLLMGKKDFNRKEYVRRLIRDGHLEARQVDGKNWFVKPESIFRYIEQQPLSPHNRGTR